LRHRPVVDAILNPQSSIFVFLVVLSAPFVPFVDSLRSEFGFGSLELHSDFGDSDFGFRETFVVAMLLAACLNRVNSANLDNAADVYK
jgi:hypothetical protein